MKSKEFKEGDKVHCMLFEKTGVVLRIDKCSNEEGEEMYPMLVYWGSLTDPEDIEVEMDNDADISEEYTLEGQIFTSPCARTLFHLEDIGRLVADDKSLDNIVTAIEYHWAIIRCLRTLLFNSSTLEVALTDTDKLIAADKTKTNEQESI